MEYLVLVCLPQEHETGRVLHDTGFSYTLGYMKFLGSKISDMPELSAEHGGDQGHHQLAACTEQAPQAFQAGLQRAMLWLAC